MRARSLLSILLISTTLLTSPCFGDVIHLKNGDRLTGNIINMEDSKLTFWSKYAGEISLFWQDVDHFSMDNTSKVILKPQAKTAEDQDPLTTTSSHEPSETTATVPSDEPLAEMTVAEPELSPDMILAINPKPVIPTKINSQINAKFTNERGNTDKDVYYINGEYIARTEQNRYTIDGEYEKEMKNDFLTEENWLVHAKFSHFIETKWYGYLDTLLENDKFKDLELRETYGLGAGYQFVENEQLNLSFSIGAAWVTESFYDADKKDFYAGQWALDFDHYLYRNIVQFFHSDKGYVSFENSNDWFIKSKTGLRFPLYKGFTATMQYEYDWDNEPASHNETEEDSKFLFLLGYHFKNH